MTISTEQIQIFYEISISIGSSMDLRKMAKTSLSTYLKKLNCSAGCILQEKDTNLENIYSIPRKIESIDIYRDTMEKFKQSLLKSDRMQSMPYVHKNESNQICYAMALPGFGLLVLISSGDGFNDYIINSIKQINLKLAGACLACVQNEALRESEEKFRAISQTSKDAIISADSREKIIFWNHGAEQIFGYSEEEILNKPLTLLIPERFQEAHEKGIRRVAAAGETHFIDKTLEVIGIHKNGQEIMLEFSQAKWEIDTGIFFSAVIRDITKKKRAEENLKIQKERLNNIIEGTNVGTWEWNVQTGETVFNEKWANLIGYTLNEISPVSIDTWMKYAHPEDLEKSNALLEKHFNGELDYYHFESRMKHKDGSWIWVLDRGKVITRDEDGKPLWVFGTHQEISERKQAEEKIRTLNRELEERVRMRTADLAAANQRLEASNQQLKAREKELSVAYDSLNSSISGVIITNQEGEITYCNPTFLQMFEYKNRDDVTGKYARDIFATEKVQKFSDVAAIIDQAKGETEEFSLKRKDGTEFPVEVSSSNVTDQEGHNVGRMASFNDITERKQAEKEITQQNDFLINVMESLTHPFYVIDVNDYSILQANTASGYIPGSSKITCHALTHNSNVPCNTQDHSCSLEEVKKTGQPVMLEHIHFDKDGNERNVEVHGFPVFDENGEINLMIEYSLDITERKQAEKEVQLLNKELEQRVKDRTAQLEASNKELEAFSYSVSHDLRAPLRAISGFTNVLVENYASKLDDEGKRYGSLISSNAQKMGRLIDDLLAFSRMSRSSMDYLKIDMNKLFDNVYHDLTTADQRKLITFKCEKLSNVIGDSSMLKQVCNNYISNAIKFSSSKKKPTITVSSYEKKGKIVYCIKDNGVGFNMDYKDKLFGVFQRLHSEDKFPGTGVGLAVVQRIINRHKGEVWAEAKIGKGASFYFSIPKK